MTSEFDIPKPTIADDTNAVVDDAAVIAKTLPLVPPESTVEWIGYLNKVLARGEDYVRANPVRAALMAAGGGALLGKLLARSLKRRRRRQA